MDKLKIAILEDNEILLKERKRDIEDSDLAKVIIWSTNSSDFLKKINETKPDALFLDIDLGNSDNMTGIEVAYLLKLPVMFVSSYNGQNLKDIEKLQSEFDIPVEHITKPFTEKEFLKIASIFLKKIKNQFNLSFVYLNLKDSPRTKIEVESIVYLESETGKSGASNNKRIFFTNRKPDTLIDFSFSKMGEIGFDMNQFIQIHKSYRFNVNKYNSYNVNNHTLLVEVMNDSGKKVTVHLPVSENYRKEVRIRLK